MAQHGEVFSLGEYYPAQVLAGFIEHRFHKQTGAEYESI